MPEEVTTTAGALVASEADVVAVAEEVESLRAIFSADGEFEFTTDAAAVYMFERAARAAGWDGGPLSPHAARHDGAAAADAAAVDDGAAARASAFLQRLDFTIKFAVDGLALSLEVQVPPGYPSRARPTLYVACDGLPRSALHTVNSAVASQMVDDSGEPCVADVALWLQGSCDELLEAASAVAKGGEHDGSGSGDGAGMASSRGSASASGAPTATEDAKTRQWIWFIGFYTQSIINAFVSTAAEHGLDGFLMPGKPAVACLEGPRRAIDGFLRVTRTELFAKVPPASRKMTVSLAEGPDDVGEGVFRGFEELRLACEAGTHKRKDMADLSALQTYLDHKGLGHAFVELFGKAGVS